MSGGRLANDPSTTAGPPSSKPAAFTDLTSACIVTLYAAYLFVTIPQLVRRLRGGIGGETGERTFSLGRWALPVNVAAVLYLLLSKRLFGLRGGHRAYEESLNEVSWLEVETSSRADDSDEPAHSRQA